MRTGCPEAPSLLQIARACQFGLLPRAICRFGAKRNLRFCMLRCRPFVYCTTTIAHFFRQDDHVSRQARQVCPLRTCCPAYRDSAGLYPTRHTEAVRFSGTSRERLAAFGVAVRRRSDLGACRRHPDPARALDPPSRLHPRWRDGSRILDVPRAEKSVSGPQRRRRVHPVLLRVPALCVHRTRSDERRWYVAGPCPQAVVGTLTEDVLRSA